MKPIAAENKPSLITGKKSKSEKNKDSSIQGKKDETVDDSKKSGDSKPDVPLHENTGTIKYKKDYAVWY